MNKTDSKKGSNDQTNAKKHILKNNSEENKKASITNHIEITV